MFWRYLKLQLLVLVCGGLVGPIFLAVYFGTGQSDLMKWMLYTGIAITAVDVVVALALTGFGASSAARTAELERSGVLALAQITGITETGTQINNQPLVKLGLHVSGAGFAPFDCEKRVIAGVARLGNITAGKLVALVDPGTGNFEIDWQRSALVNGLMPAQFTVDEDNRTYDLTGRAGPLMEILQILKANGVALGRMIDVRSNPALRQQIHAVVRRAAVAAQPVAVADPEVARPEASIGERLQELDELHRGGVLTEEEYASRRAQIIAEI